VRTVNGKVLWANLHLLFWLSVVPFVTSWMGENPLGTTPVAAYGVILLMNAIAYAALQTVLIAHEGPDSDLAKAMRSDFKGKISIVLYVVAVAAAFFVPALSLALYAIVAGIWFIPDRRVERQLGMT
jgi:uncharacterized membrane protein